MKEAVSPFGQYLRRKRVEAGLSLRQVADAVGISHASLGEVERGVRAGLKPERIPMLAEVIPGFSAVEASRLLADATNTFSISLGNDRARYRDLMFALARRVEKDTLLESDIRRLRSILDGEEDDDP